MILKYDDIPRKGKAVAFKVGAERLAAALLGCEGARPDGELSVQVSLQRGSGGGLGIAGRISATLNLTCARCLKDHVHTVDREFKYHLLPPEGELGGEVELGADELDVAFFDGRTIDLGAAAIEELSLALPYRFLCAQGCRGLCPGCGKDLGVEDCVCESKESKGPFSGLKSLVLNG